MSLLESELRQFTGTENYYKWTLSRSTPGDMMLYTDGVKHVAETREAYWLIDAIFSYLMPIGMSRETVNYKARREPFQVWDLQVGKDNTAVLTMRRDSGAPAIVEQKIEYTDFPYPGVTLWVERDEQGFVLLVPSEH